jgi:predicted CoA-binding protein
MGQAADVNRWSDPAVVDKILSTYRTFAVVGCSDDPRRPSYGVATFLQDQGYEVICVNPNHFACIEGAPCFEDLHAIDRPVEVVDLFRRPDAVLPHVQEAIDIGAKAVWMQIGVINEEAAQLAADAGLDVVMDRCPKIEFRPSHLAARS